MMSDNLSDILGEDPGSSRGGDAPPRRRPPRSTPPPASGGGGADSGDEKPRRRPPWATKLEVQIADGYRAIGTGFAVTGDTFSSSLIGAQAQPIAHAWVELAERDANVRKTLERLMSGSAWGGLVMMHIMLILPILASRDLIPGELGQRLKAMVAFMQPTPDYPPNGDSAD